MAPDVLFLPEAETYSRVSVTTLRRAIKAGNLPAVKKAQKWRIHLYLHKPVECDARGMVPICDWSHPIEGVPYPEDQVRRMVELVWRTLFGENYERVLSWYDNPPPCMINGRRCPEAHAGSGGYSCPRNAPDLCNDDFEWIEPNNDT